jgi:ribosomal protein S18 acetylase RimI-like enzyme
MAQARIHPVRSRADARAYLSLTREPYVKSPTWVHPDVRVLKNLFRRKTLLAERSEWQALWAEEEGRPVACLTVFVHKSFEEKFRRKIATIGFFEALTGHAPAVDDLFVAAEDWARERHATRIWGPMNGHIMYGFGCLENRYDELPVVGTVYNLSDYPAHWWRHGYKHAPSFYSYAIDLTKPQTRSTIAELAENPKLRLDPEITLRTADTKQWRREVGIFIDLHNEAFENNWGDTPLSHEEIWELMGLARLTVDPELYWIAEIRGKPVGMVLCMPDFNQVFRHVRGEPAGLRAGLALLLHRKQIRRGGAFAIGVLKEARGRGLAETLTARALRRMIARGFTEAEYCLVLEDNAPSQRIARRFGGDHTKTYLMFEKLLS